jgi:hypothetical protein
MHLTKVLSVAVGNSPEEITIRPAFFLSTWRRSKGARKLAQGFPDKLQLNARPFDGRMAFVPEGHMTVARRFIAGSRST